MGEEEGRGLRQTGETQPTAPLTAAVFCTIANAILSPRVIRSFGWALWCARALTTARQRSRYERVVVGEE